ncbi:DUF6083 domain-containing protein [Streptomyces sp. NPDC002917]|uniref:DUF6083 domain-containing protein n=1 Tax=unclassified Streptomyces TaxID=2593676 RepID=UPI002E810D03|nr:DUF6083 domain-containing protein [Streptomyces sp. NBC_00562]WTF25948.1 DUF6083 domain-containing protein [Streptomyces sp. NBC_01602]WUC24287.1 DUF6083 domain-containing protein [Streptomyces sp. NBC_00562]
MGDTGTPQTAQEWAELQQDADYEQARDDGAIPGPEPGPACPDCGLGGDIHATYYHWWIRLEPEDPEPLAAHTVPPRQRWYLDSNGTAWNSQDDEPDPGQTCRISHGLVCSRAERPDLAQWLTSRTAANEVRAALLPPQLRMQGDAA